MRQALVGVSAVFVSTNSGVEARLSSPEIEDRMNEDRHQWGNLMSTEDQT